MFSKATGVNIRFIQSKVEGGKRVGKNGSYDPDSNTIEIDVYAGIVNAKSINDSIIPTLSHEITHWMKNKAPALYDTFRNEIMNTLVASRITKDVAVRKTSEDLIEDELARLRKKHPNEEWTEEDAIDEIVARACEDMLRNSDAARKLIGKLKPAEQNKIIAKLKEIVKNLLEWVNNLLKEYASNSYEARLLSEYKENLKKLSKMWDEMLVTAVKNNQALQKEKVSENKQSKDVQKKQYSEREIIGESGTNYGVGVYLDDNLLTGLTDEERKEMVKEYVVSELAGQHFIAYDGNKDVVDVGIAKKSDKFLNNNGKKRQVLKELYGKYNGFKVKQEAVVLVDELIANAKYDTSAKPKYPHDWLDDNGKNNWEYWTVFIQEKNKTVWEATLNIANTSNGEKLLYDIDPIEKVEEGIKFPSTSTNNNIPQTPEKVKTQFSDRDSDDYSRIQEMQTELNKTRDSIKEIESSDEFKEQMNKLSSGIGTDDVDKAIEEYQKWGVDSGYSELIKKKDSLQTELDNLRKQYSENIANQAIKKEKEAIAKSGLNEADYFRKLAVKEFGYTPYFYDAGYIVPNGKMLNFSGEKGQHFGSRGQDHRAIGAIYANVEGSQAMLKFMGEGNIRIMPESPGLDISSSSEPTSEQYATIRKFVREYAKEEYLNIDLTDEQGNVVGNYEYEGKVTPDRVLNDIKYFFANGTTREQSSVSKFLYSDRDYSYDELVSKGNLQGVVIKNNQQVKLTGDGSIDVKWVVNEVRKKCKSLQTHSASPTYYIEVPDIGRNVIIDRDSIEHNLRKSKNSNTQTVSPKALLNARVSLELPEILKNSIEVNRSVRGDNMDVPYSHIMLGTAAFEDATGNLEYYAVRSVIEERINQDPILAEAEILGRLHAINTKK